MYVYFPSLLFSYIFIMCIIPFFLLAKLCWLNIIFLVLPGVFCLWGRSQWQLAFSSSLPLCNVLFLVYFFHFILSFDVSVIQTFPFSKGKWFRQNLMWSILQVSMQQENSTVAWTAVTPYNNCDLSLSQEVCVCLFEGFHHSLTYLFSHQVCCEGPNAHLLLMPWSKVLSLW